MRTTRTVKRASTTRKEKKVTRTSSVTSIENGIKIVQYALKHNTSVSAAASILGRGKNYVSDIKTRLEENLVNKNISRDLYREFKKVNKEYQKTLK